jgi:hypothetical protein
VQTGNHLNGRGRAIDVRITSPTFLANCRAASKVAGQGPVPRCATPLPTWPGQ